MYPSLYFHIYVAVRLAFLYNNLAPTLPAFITDSAQNPAPEMDSSAEHQLYEKP
jgi:hypothetical protein